MKRLKLLGLTSAFLGILLFATAQLAGAHHAILAGQTECFNGDHAITWSISNSVPHRDMTIFSAVVMLNGTSYPITGYTNPVPGGGTTGAASMIPGTETGTVTLTVEGHWADGHTSDRHVDVLLAEPCSTTTTTSPSETTTAPTTTVKPTTTSMTPTTTYLGTPTSECGTATTCPTLAFTAGGTHSADFAALGLTLLGLGAVLLTAAGLGVSRRRFLGR